MSSVVNGTWRLGEYGYSSQAVREKFRNKVVVFVGDSVTRSLYKDFVGLLRGDAILSERILKIKGEESCLGDSLIEGGTLDGLFNGKEYLEVREYRTPAHCVRFYFVTRAYYDYAETILSDFLKSPQPDVVYWSSCCWDVTRWNDEVKQGAKTLTKYKKNLIRLFRRFGEVLPVSCVVLWGCCMPLGEHVRGGFLERGSEALNISLRLDVLEANYFAAEVARYFQYDVIDFHFYFRHFQDSRKLDGIHWNSSAHRNMSFMLINYVFDAWSVDLKPRSQFGVKLTRESAGENNFSMKSSTQEDFTHLLRRWRCENQENRPGSKMKDYRSDHRNERRYNPYEFPLGDRSRHQSNNWRGWDNPSGPYRF